MKRRTKSGNRLSRILCLSSLIRDNCRGGREGGREGGSHIVGGREVRGREKEGGW